MALAIAAVLLVMPSCQHQPVMTHSRFVHLPAGGWQRTMPLSFKPQYDDSTMTYDLTLAVRHTGSYRYRNLSLVVDIIAADSAVDRHTVNMTLANDYGNWHGGGFGSLYQATAELATAVRPIQARSVIIWQAMNGCDTLSGLDCVGLIVRPD